MAQAAVTDLSPVDPDAASWPLLGALQTAAFAGQEARVEEIKLAVAAIAELIADSSLAHWNDQPDRTQAEVEALLERAETLTELPVDPFD